MLIGARDRERRHAVTRSEVVRIHRYDIDRAIPAGPDPRIASELISDLCQEIPVGQTKSVRISAEIVEEREEEKVGSHVLLKKLEHVHGKGYAYLDGYRFGLLDDLVKDWQPSESRKVKSINFDTPSGVPEVTFCETPRERLKRAVDEAYATKTIGQGYETLRQAINVYLAATDGEGK